jgi:hypothetical protein
LETISKAAVHLVLLADGDRQVQSSVKHIYVLAELAALEDMVRLESDCLVLVLSPCWTQGEHSGEGCQHDCTT